MTVATTRPVDDTAAVPVETDFERARRRRVRTGLLVLAAVAVAAVAIYQFWDLSNASSYALDLRRRQLLTLVIAGASCGVSAILFQTLAGSPLLTPGVMGFDALYVLLGTLIVLLFGSDTLAGMSPVTTTVMNAGALCVFGVLIFGLLLKVSGRNLVVMVLIGMVCSALFSSLGSFASRMLSPTDFLTVQDIMFASFSTADESVLMVTALLTAAAIACCIPLVRYLDLLNLGAERAIGLGLPDRVVVGSTLALITVLVASSTALVGPMTFLGLIVANVARQVVGTPRHGPLLLGALLVGAIATVLGQLLVSRVLDFAAPLSVVINLVGGAYFIFLLMRRVRL
ncbi:iron chelate uptake ABC transporter family permease subunit [Calidifontibacter indicus]|uniref:Iron complex transport system permease protein n=1 Tax=Calidifontibacter indicus TaxID=419650 RepID=A0A3D9UT33_9MICO|nr:iron chelate uptake ABC transporter family permease subunit [Calidifontibacter indicus]REF31683.1 iron complex transport system permease protein [Calidifontibacter indicus]